MRRFLLLLFLIIPTLAWGQTPPTGFVAVSGTGWTQAGGVATAPAIFGYDRWNTTAYGPDQQVACTISTLPSDGATFNLLARFESMSNRWRLTLNRVVGADDTLTLSEFIDNASIPTQTIGPISLGVNAQVNDKIGMKVVSNVVTGVYWSQNASWSTLCAGGGDWCEIVSGTATNTPSLSYIGMGATSPAACTEFFGQGDSVTQDTTPPSPDPPTWTATPTTVTSQTEINLAANLCTDSVGVVSYLFEVCDGAACSDFGTPAIAPSESPTITVSGLTANTLYRFRLKCSDGTNISTTYSAIQDATTFTNPDTTAPTAPTNLMVSRVAGNSDILDDVLLSWTASTDTGGSGINFYRIEQGDAACNNFVEIAQTPSTSATLSVGEASIPLNATRCYKVRAEDIAQNNSSYSSNVILYPVSGGRFR